MGGIRDRYSLPSRVPSFHGMDKEAPCCFPFVVVKHGLTHFNHFKVCNWRAFSTFIILSNHPQGLVWEHFYHSKKKSCTHYTATPTFLLPLPQSLARIDLSECFDHSVFVRHCTSFIRHILINSHESNSLPFHRWAETQKKNLHKVTKPVSGRTWNSQPSITSSSHQVMSVVYRTFPETNMNDVDRGDF